MRGGDGEKRLTPRETADYFKKGQGDEKDSS